MGVALRNSDNAGRFAQRVLVRCPASCTGDCVIVLPARINAGGGAERGFDIEQARFRSCRQRLGDIGQVRLPVSVAERGLDIEQAGFRVCRQHLYDNGGDGADIAGAVGKQHGVTVLEGKRHKARLVV